MTMFDIKAGSAKKSFNSNEALDCCPVCDDEGDEAVNNQFLLPFILQ